MSDEQINRAVAEELGWAPKKHRHGFWSMLDVGGNSVGRNHHGGLDEDHCWRVCNLDFCTDHNAAAEIRRAIGPENRMEYQVKMELVVYPNIPEQVHRCGTSSTIYVYYNMWLMINASPRQQAEAFLKMRGKWRDGE